MGYTEPSKKRNFIISISAVILVFVIIPLIAFVISRIYSGKIIITVAPQSALIKLNGKLISAGEQMVVPGKYEVEAYRDGFAADTQEIEVLADETLNIYFILSSNDPSTENWYAEHPDDQLIAEGIGSERFNTINEASIAAYPITKKLPYETANYTIGYGNCGEIEFCIIINAEAGFRDVALKRFLQINDDPAQYYFRFIDYVNPFLGGE